MVCFLDDKELEKDPYYLKFRMNLLLWAMKYECLGDMERQPYKQEYLRLEKELKNLLDN